MPNRREFLEMSGAGLLITVMVPIAEAQRGEGTLEARLHIGEDGIVTVLTGKIDEGQGARTELAMVAAEELRVSVERVRMLMADTDRTPNDGVTAGSMTTPRTAPLVRKAAAAARDLLIAAAAGQWKVDRARVQVNDGTAGYAGRKYGYAELARSPELAAAYKQALPPDTTLTSAKEWRVLGKPQLRLEARDIVTGSKRFPSDTARPGMLYGSVLRPPAYGATLTGANLPAAQKMPGVVAVRDGGFVGCAAPTTFAARKAVEAIAAQWKTVEQPSSENLFEYLKQHAGGEGRGRGQNRGSVEQALAAARHRLKASYQVAYVQHAPLEPRAAVAEWQDGRLTVWTGTSNPFSVRQQLAEAFQLKPEAVRVIVPDMGGGFGGKHTGEAAVEAARLAKAAGRPVKLQWTRAEEFMWAYFRPAALIEVEAGVDASNSIAAWEFTNYNSGASALNTPYRVPNTRERFIECDSPLRQGSYRCLAATANNFAREAFTDEVAEAAGRDPLEFRLAHLDNERLRNVLTAAAGRFGWSRRSKQRRPGVGVGLACGTEKNSVVAACVEVEMDGESGMPKLTEIVQAFECGPILNPANLRRQVEGCIMMGLGPALREEVQFKDGRLTNGRFAGYRVARFRDLPKAEIVLLDRKDLEPAGAGETPIIAVAPAVANAVFAASGKRVRSMPVGPVKG